MIPSTITAVQTLTNGVSTQYSFPNKIFAASDLIVSLIVNATGQITVLTLGSNYTVSNVDVDTGCYITTALAYPTGYTIDIRTEMGQVQLTSIKNQQNFLPELHEEAFDRVTRELQDVYRQAYLFSVHGPDNEATAWPALPGPAGRANTNLGFGPGGALALNLNLTSGTLSQATIGLFLYPVLGLDGGAAVNLWYK